MAASYSSFLTSSFYSPIFNTALFDGAFRFYFSQSYEAVVLKVYHILQSEHSSLWAEYKEWSEKTKKNVFVLVYPTEAEVKEFFSEKKETPILKIWEEGLVIAFGKPSLDLKSEQFDQLTGQIVKLLEQHMSSGETHKYNAEKQ